MVRLLFRGFDLLNRSTQVPPCSTVDGTAQILDLNGDSRVDVLDVVILAQFLFETGGPPVRGLECFGVSAEMRCSQNNGCQ